VVVAWLGNSERIALKHYLQVTDNHLAAASTFGVGQQAETSLAETTESSGNQGKKTLIFPRILNIPQYLRLKEYPEQDSNLRPTD
jgi:hypothetical protein